MPASPLRFLHFLVVMLAVSMAAAAFVWAGPWLSAPQVIGYGAIPAAIGAFVAIFSFRDRARTKETFAKVFAPSLVLGIVWMLLWMGIDDGSPRPPGAPAHLPTAAIFGAIVAVLSIIAGFLASGLRGMARPPV